jgi:hypothetical protein
MIYNSWLSYPNGVAIFDCAFHAQSGCRGTGPYPCYSRDKIRSVDLLAIILRRLAAEPQDNDTVGHFKDDVVKVARYRDH